MSSFQCQGPYVPFATSIRRSGLSMPAKLVWAELASHDSEYNPSIRQIAKGSEIKHLVTVRKAIKELEHRKAITVERRSGKLTKYTVHDTVSPDSTVNQTVSPNSTALCHQMTQTVSPNSTALCHQMTQSSYIEDKTKDKLKDKLKDKQTPPPKKSKPKKTTPKYTDQDRHAANQWHEYLKEHHPHHEKRIKILATAAAIQTLRLKEGISYTELLKWQQLCSEDEFWRSNLISLAGLVKKRWKNGTRAIDNLKEAADKRYKRKEELQQQDAFMYGNIIDMESTGVVTI